MTTEMDIQEINKVLAERVMGWKLGNVSRKLEHDPRFDVWRDEEWSVHIKPANAWNPTSDLNQAMMIVEKLLERGYMFYLYMGAKGGSIARFSKSIREDDDYLREYEGKLTKMSYFTGKSQIPAEAICLAAIQLVQEGK